MGVNAPAILQAKWPILVANGLTKKVTYNQMAASVYTPSDGKVEDDVTTSYTLDVVLDEVTTFPFGQGPKGAVIDDATIEEISKLAIFPTLNLPVYPALHDILIDPKGKAWDIVSIVEDPADAHMELYLKAKT